MSEIPSLKETDASRIIIGGKAMRQIYCTISKYAKFADTILLVGETGVGKDLIAHEIHRLSDRKDNLFKLVSLSALSNTLLESELFGHVKGAFTGADKDKTGVIEAADGGTLYFPEISEIPQSIQLKLLDFTQYRMFNKVGQDHWERTKRVDVRLIFATNEDPEECVRIKKLREDFYYRINKYIISIPPLRERREEIGPLAEHFAKVYGKRLFRKEVNISREAIELLKQYHWPGNVRELEGMIERAIITLSTELGEDKKKKNGISLDVKHLELLKNRNINRESHRLSIHFSSSEDFPSWKAYLRECKRLYFEEVLRRTGGDRSETVRMAGLSERGLRYILRDFGNSE